MKLCITELVKAEAIYLLPDSVDSKGAKLECVIAHSIGIVVTTDLLGLNYVRLQKFKIPSE